MNTSTLKLIPIALLLGAGAAHADGGFAQAMLGEDSGSFYLSQHAAAGTRTRDEVVAEMLVAKASGEIDVMIGEDSGSFHLAQRATRAADTVVADADHVARR
jgi:aspartate oxidase